MNCFFSLRNPIGLVGAVAAFVFSLSACGDDSGTSSKSVYGTSMQLENYDDLPNCSRNRDGVVFEITAERKAYLCDNGRWEFYYDVLDSVKTEEDLSACLLKNEGDSVWVVEKSAVFVCTDRKWEKHVKEDPEDSSKENEIPTYDTEDDLPNCTKDRQGNLALVDSAAWQCDDGRWQDLGHVYGLEDDLPNCTSKLNFEIVYILETRSSMTCVDKRWNDGRVEKQESSSSSSSSSRHSELDSESSSSKKAVSSSAVASSNSAKSSGSKVSSSSAPTSSNSEKSSSSKKALSSSAVASSSSKKAVSSSAVASSSSKKALSSSAVASSSSKKQEASSSSVKQVPPSSSSKVVASSASNSLYDCSVYDCVTTKFLNQDMLASGKYGELLDSRDNQVYRTIQIGEQVWFAQNLNYKTSTSKCYANSSSNCDSLGRLYLQSEANSVCPSGWHLPSNAEWNELNDYVDSKNGSEGVGNSLKSLTWTYGEKGSDKVGFSGIASRYFGDVLFCGSSSHGLYWTSDANEYRCLLSDNTVLYHYKDMSSDTWGMSVRCLKGNPPVVSSSSVASSSSAKVSSSSVSTAKYDCSVYKCISTDGLNQTMLKAGKYGEFLDVRDNQVYKTIQIGSQLWTAQNMNYDMTGGFCSSDNCNTYGRFYNWDASVKACPAGWHLPSRSEWKTLAIFVTKDSTSMDSVGTKLRSLTGWSGNSTDEFGFSALSAGSMRSASGDIYYAGVHVGFWTSTENAKDNSKATLLFTDYRDTEAGFSDDEPKYRGFSVRCVKD